MSNNVIQYKHHQRLSTALRILAIEMVEEAKSGHPGMPMGFADVATVLFQYFLKFNPQDPTWTNRDRFILSAGHGSALLYALLYLTGYEKYTIPELKKFRQLNSITPGHPEFNPNLGVEVTTGPLGQGIANAVGMAIAGKKLNKGLDGAINHKIYVVAGDGCLMEGITHEAMSLAGHLGLNNLVVLFDNNKISIDGATSLTVSDITPARISSYNWDVISIDGHNPNAIWNALSTAQKAKKPTFIACKTKIGYGSPNFENSEESHGKNLGNNEIELIKKNFNWNYKKFSVPEPILKVWRNFYRRCLDEYNDWQTNYQNQWKQFFKASNNIEPALNKVKELKNHFLSIEKVEATRKSSQKVIEKISPVMMGLIGGSADLSASNGTKSSHQKTISKCDFSGNYIHYGVREHAMVAIMNGMKTYGCFTAYSGTFLVFSDYCQPSIRLASLMRLPIILVFTHDSIGVGEDGPTHQPIEHLTGLRAIPNLNVFRPADAVETAECWELMLQQKNTPSAICLTRQNVLQLRNTVDIDNTKNLVEYGAYVLYQSSDQNDRVSIFASGSEVSLALDVAKNLEIQGVGSKVISVPCQELFWQQSAEYQTAILCNDSIKVAIEAGIEQSWSKIIGADGLFCGVETFGKSAPSKDLYEYFELTTQKITEKILKIINY